jgi:hypothetical protein
MQSEDMDYLDSKKGGRENGASESYRDFWMNGDY